MEKRQPPERNKIGGMASHPGRVILSHEKLRELVPDFYETHPSLQQSLTKIKSFIEEQLYYGDSRAAVVMTLSPLLVAAYTDEFDCVAMLRFPDVIADIFKLTLQTRLLTVNTYNNRSDGLQADLIPGLGFGSSYTGFNPIIADFVTVDDGRVSERIREIDESEWERTVTLGGDYLKLRPGLARDGRPMYASIAALPIAD